MTNKEKFKEIFGYEANTDECPIYCISNDSGECPYYNSTSNVCSAGYWWDVEYKETTTKKMNDNEKAISILSKMLTDKPFRLSGDEVQAIRYAILSIEEGHECEQAIEKIRAEIKTPTIMEADESEGYINES